MTIEQVIDELCIDNKDAKSFLFAFFQWTSWIDDVADGDEVGDSRHIAKLNLEFLVTAASNPFFQAHRDAFTALFIQSLAAWVDSNEWATRPDPKHRLAADVLKGYYHEVFWHTAALCGGIDHMLMITAKYREFDFEECTTKHDKAEEAVG